MKLDLEATVAESALGRTHVRSVATALPCPVRRAGALVCALDARGNGSVRFPVRPDGLSVGVAEWTDANGVTWVLSGAHQPTHDVDSAAHLLAWMLEDEVLNA